MSDAQPDDPRRQPPGMFSGAWTLARVRGVPLRLHGSVLIIAGLVGWGMVGSFERLLGGSSRVAALAAALVGVVLFVASILAHELAHTLTSLNRGIPVRGVTLFLLGGVTESTREARSARDEFVIVGSGPLTSLVLGAVFGLGATFTAGNAVVAGVLGYLGWLNVALGVFNLVPGYPLDGGRLLRSILWGATKRRHLATRWSARVGQVFAVALMGLGVWEFTQSAGGFSGLWYVLIGFFLFRGATEAHGRARLTERVAAQTARSVMGSLPPVLDPELPLRAAVQRVAERPSLVWPVGDPLVGGITLADIDRVPDVEWDVVTVGRVAVPAEVVGVDAGTPMDAVLERLGQVPGQMLVVTDQGRPVGLVTASLVSHLAA